MDIGFVDEWPASVLSNFSPHEFVFDGVPCASMEGLLQSFKFADEREQVEVCALVGIDAKRRGRKKNSAWKAAQVLWWKGQTFQRAGQDYQALLDTAFAALFTNDDFRRALLATGRAELTHSIGISDLANTVLTEHEFCSRLTKLREQL